MAASKTAVSAHAASPAALGLLALLLALMLSGCASSAGLVLHEVGSADPQQPGEYRNASADQARQGLRIVRGGAALAAEVGMALATGDVLESGADTLAVIRFPDGHEVTLLPRTRVQLGSLSTFFGQIYVRAYNTVQDLKERFKVKTRYVTAGVEGTAFWVRVDSNHRVVFGVVEGRIDLSSPGGLWPAVPVLPDEVATVLRDAAPTKAQQPRDQVDSIVRLMRNRLRMLPRPPVNLPR